MITTVIGKTFLKAYNAKYNTQYPAKEFFEKIYFELFFNHSKYMQWVTNSPFVQEITTGDDGEYGVEKESVKISDTDSFGLRYRKLVDKYGKERLSIKTQKQKKIISILLKNDSIQRKERLVKFQQIINRGTVDGSIAIGYPASEIKEYGTYSGLVSDLEIKTSEEDVYFSWLGSGLSVGIAGDGYAININHPEVLLYVFEGWKVYRDLLSNRSLENLKGNLITSWNGQWLTYRLGPNFKNDFKVRDLEQEGVFKIDKEEGLGFQPVNWPNLFFSLSNRFPNTIFMSNISKLGKENQTIGFIPFYLKSGKRLKDVYKQIYKTDAPFRSRDFQSLFGIYIKKATQLGSIGLEALRPQELSKYFKNDKNISFNKELDVNNYQSYKTWLVAMLSKNKQEITDYTSEIATMLQRYRAAGTKTDRKNLIEKSLLASNSKRLFLDALTEVLNEIGKDDLPKIKELRDEVHLMTNEEFVYFNTLLKFDYKYAEKDS